MKPEAIVYTSRSGYTRQYAEMLAEEWNLPAVSLEEAALPRGTGVVYLGWICASHIRGYGKAARRFRVLAVCGVGLGDTGTLVAEVRKATGVSAGIPLFTLQGGFCRSSLRGVNKLLIAMLTKGLTDQKTRSPQDERMLELLTRDNSYVSRENLAGILECFHNQ